MSLTCFFFVDFCWPTTIMISHVFGLCWSLTTSKNLAVPIAPASDSTHNKPLTVTVIFQQIFPLNSMDFPIIPHRLSIFDGVDVPISASNRYPGRRKRPPPRLDPPKVGAWPPVLHVKEPQNGDEGGYSF